jgi:hypothetical protein
MIDALLPVAFAHLIAHQSRHHAPDPLLADDGVSGLLELSGIVVVDAVKGGSDGWLLGEKGGGLRGRHIIHEREEEWGRPAEILGIDCSVHRICIRVAVEVLLANTR